jgi:YbbR domain-containing protein
MRVSLAVMRVGIILSAILLWANVQAFAFRVETISIPLTVTNLQAGLAVSTPLPHIQVQLSGRSFYLNRVTEKNLQFGINLGAASGGSNITAPVELISSPSQVHVLSFEPSQLDLSVDTAITKDFPVVLDTQGWVSDGYALTDLVSEPSTVTVSGSPALLSRISQVVGLVDINRKRASFSVPVEIKAELGDTIAHLQVNPQSVTAKATIQKGSAMRNLGVKPAFTGSLPAGYFIREVKFNPPTVLVSGNQRILSSLTNLISTPINLANQRKTYTSSVAIDLPTGVKIVGENLLRAEIIVELAEASREFTVTPQFMNITDGFSVAAITPKTIKLVVLGEEDVLRNLARKDIQLNIDLQGILSGATSIPITPGMFVLPPGVSVGSFTPEVLEVILARAQQ